MNRYLHQLELQLLDLFCIACYVFSYSKTISSNFKFSSKIFFYRSYWTAFSFLCFVNLILFVCLYLLKLHYIYISSLYILVSYIYIFVPNKLFQIEKQENLAQFSIIKRR
jgi:hypothetical protein